MKISDEVKFITLFFLVVASIAAMFFQPRYPTIKYDCRVAEISPDVPPKVKEECRKLMSKYQKTQ
jgi:hypothetical protein